MTRLPSSFPFLPESVLRTEPTVWRNPGLRTAEENAAICKKGQSHVAAAVARWQRFAPLLSRCFPALAQQEGRVDSPLLKQREPERSTLWVKADHALPITGTIKARGGVYEVLCHAEALALKAGLVQLSEDYAFLAEAAGQQLFSERRILVGSTGNLGYSVGVIGRALGFDVEVHMSQDAAEWKKERLRALGATVVSHEGDYAQAVAAARERAAQDAQAYFVDDENSLLLFLGYAAAGCDLRNQLKAEGITPTPEKPLRVYLPCGVGGAPGGVAFGLRCLYGDAVQCVFVEPVASPCFLLRLASGDDKRSVYDIGLDNHTVADGLAVPRASPTVARIMQHMVDAIITVDDAALMEEVKHQWQQHGLRLEPSAAAGFVAHRMAKAPWPQEVIPLVWTTGGSGLPDAVFLPWVRGDD